MNEEEKNNYVIEVMVNNYYSESSSYYLPSMYDQLNAAEKSLAAAHPYQATQYYVSAEVAENYTNNLFGYNGYQDSSDAFRHAFWNGVLTMRIGSSAAKTWTDAHETTSSGVDKQMDLFNNSLGRSICVDMGYDNFSGSSNSQGIATKLLSDSVYSAIKSGKGKIIVNGVLRPSN